MQLATDDAQMHEANLASGRVADECVTERALEQALPDFRAHNIFADSLAQTYADRKPSPPRGTLHRV